VVDFAILHVVERSQKTRVLKDNEIACLVTQYRAYGLDFGQYKFIRRY